MTILVPPELESKACVFPISLGWFLIGVPQGFPSLASPMCSPIFAGYGSLRWWSRNCSGASEQPFTVRSVWLCPLFAHCPFSCLSSPSTHSPLPLIPSTSFFRTSPLDTPSWLQWSLRPLTHLPFRTFYSSHLLQVTLEKFCWGPCKSLQCALLFSNTRHRSQSSRGAGPCTYPRSLHGGPRIG